MTRAAAAAVVALAVAVGACREGRMCATSGPGFRDDFPTAQAAFDDFVADVKLPVDRWVVKEELAESVTWRREAGNDWQEVRVRKLGERWRYELHSSCVTGARDPA